MRLIDADALTADIQTTIEESGCVNHEGEILDCIAYADEIDAVLVVRCKDCKQYNTSGYPALNPGTGWCERMGRGVSDDFYCAYGAKLEDKP